MADKHIIDEAYLNNFSEKVNEFAGNVEYYKPAIEDPLVKAEDIAKELGIKSTGNYYENGGNTSAVPISEIPYHLRNVARDIDEKTMEHFEDFENYMATRHASNIAELQAFETLLDSYTEQIGVGGRNIGNSDFLTTFQSLRPNLIYGIGSIAEPVKKEFEEKLKQTMEDLKAKNEELSYNELVKMITDELGAYLTPDQLKQYIADMMYIKLKKVTGPDGGTMFTTIRDEEINGGTIGEFHASLFSLTEAQGSGLDTTISFGQFDSEFSSTQNISAKEVMKGLDKKAFEVFSVKYGISFSAISMVVEKTNVRSNMLQVSNFELNLLKAEAEAKAALTSKGIEAKISANAFVAEAEATFEWRNAFNGYTPYIKPSIKFLDAGSEGGLEVTSTKVEFTKPSFIAPTVIDTNAKIGIKKTDTDFDLNLWYNEK